MDADTYAKQRGELERGISYAEAAYQSASFRASTGAAKPEEVSNARAHYEAMKAKLGDLVAAFHGAQVAASSNAKAARAMVHAKLEKDVDAFAAKRLSLTKTILKHCEALAAAVSEHDRVTREMRSHVLKQTYGKGQLQGFDNVFANAVSPYSITGAALALGGLQSSLIVGNRDFFDQLSAEERELRFAEQLRGNLRLLAPKEA